MSRTSPEETARRIKIVTEGFRDGLKLREVAELCGLSVAVIEVLCRAHGIVNPNGRLSEGEIAIIKGMDEQKAHPDEIIKKLAELYPSRRSWKSFKSGVQTIRRYRKNFLGPEEIAELRRKSDLRRQTGRDDFEIESRSFGELLNSDDPNKIEKLSLGYGSIVGDGFISVKGKKESDSEGSRLVISHAEDQRDYLIWKRGIWSDILKYPITYLREAHQHDHHQKSYIFHSLKTPTLYEFREDYVPVRYKSGTLSRQNIKIFYRPDEFLQKLEVYHFLFTLFMDDGSTHFNGTNVVGAKKVWKKMTAKGREGKEMPTQWHNTPEGRRAVSKARQDPEILNSLYSSGNLLTMRIKQKQMLDSELERMRDFLISKGLDCRLYAEKQKVINNYEGFFINGKWTLPDKRLVTLAFSSECVYNQLIPEFRKIAEKYDFPKDMLEYKLKHCSIENCKESLAYMHR